MTTLHDYYRQQRLRDIIVKDEQPLDIDWIDYWNDRYILAYRIDKELSYELLNESCSKERIDEIGVIRTGLELFMNEMREKIDGNNNNNGVTEKAL